MDHPNLISADSSERELLVGLDLGGTKIEGVIIDPRDPHHPLARLRVPTGAEIGYDYVLGQISDLVGQLKAACSGPFPTIIGMGTPGAIDPQTRNLRGSNAQKLNGRPLQEDLEQRLGLKFQVANDANCFAIAEATMGVARGYETVFGVILGTGVGGGFVVNGKTLNGCHGIGGEWGQIVVEPGGAVSKHGTRGTMEGYVAGPALENFYAEQSGGHRPLKEIVQLADRDPIADATIDRLQEYVARGLAMIINTFDPHAIVFGGGVGTIDALYTEKMRERIAGKIFAPRLETALLRPALGDSAGVFGAAMLTAGISVGESFPSTNRESGVDFVA